MLSYRHAFHAGNFADLLKHLILCECLDYLKRKDKAFVYLDTHAGPGEYALDSDFAQKNQEYRNGIETIWSANDLPEALNRYRDSIRSFNPEGTLKLYPGSPRIAQQSLRSGDRLELCELHNTEIQALSGHFKTDSQAQVWHLDGFERLLKALPPQERRGLILVDPSYELKADYDRVVDSVRQAHRKFAQGLYLIWYPVVDRARIEHIHQQFIQSGIPKIEAYEYGLQPDTDGRGMTASGMIVINPPWTLKDQIEPALQYLVEKLSHSEQAYYSAVTLVAET